MSVYANDSFQKHNGYQRGSPPDDTDGSENVQHGWRVNDSYIEPSVAYCEWRGKAGSEKFEDKDPVLCVI